MAGFSTLTSWDVAPNDLRGKIGAYVPAVLGQAQPGSTLLATASGQATGINLCAQARIAPGNPPDAFYNSHGVAVAADRERSVLAPIWNIFGSSGPFNNENSEATRSQLINAVIQTAYLVEYGSHVGNRVPPMQTRVEPERPLYLPTVAPAAGQIPYFPALPVAGLIGPCDYSIQGRAAIDEVQAYLNKEIRCMVEVKRDNTWDQNGCLQFHGELFAALMRRYWTGANTLANGNEVRGIYSNGEGWILALHRITQPGAGIDLTIEAFNPLLATGNGGTGPVMANGLTTLDLSPIDSQNRVDEFTSQLKNLVNVLVRYVAF